MLPIRFTRSSITASFRSREFIIEIFIGLMLGIARCFIIGCACVDVVAASASAAVVVGTLDRYCCRRRYKRFNE